MWSGFAFDVEAEALLKQIQDSDFHDEVVRVKLRKEAECGNGLLPRYCTSECCYHTHTVTGGQSCGEMVKVLIDARWPGVMVPSGLPVTHRDMS